METSTHSEGCISQSGRCAGSCVSGQSRLSKSLRRVVSCCLVSSSRGYKKEDNYGTNVTADNQGTVALLSLIMHQPHNVFSLYIYYILCHVISRKLFINFSLNTSGENTGICDNPVLAPFQYQYQAIKRLHSVSQTGSVAHVFVNDQTFDCQQRASVTSEMIGKHGT